MNKKLILYNLWGEDVCMYFYHGKGYENLKVSMMLAYSYPYEEVLLE